MSIFSVNKAIYMRQGDTGNIIVKGLPKDKNYSVYLSVYNPDENKILAELLAASYSQATGVAIFTYDEDFSNSLPVGEWVWGLKICANGSEDTLIPKVTIENGKINTGVYPAFTVDNKIVEGS